jgi:hypothetical protein
MFHISVLLLYLSQQYFQRGNSIQKRRRVVGYEIPLDTFKRDFVFILVINLCSPIDIARTIFSSEVDTVFVYGSDLDWNKLRCVFFD